MASGSASYNGRNVTVTVAYPGRLANYGGSGRDAICRSIEIQGDGGGYVTIASGLSSTGTDFASYTWTYNYSTNHTWDSRGYYTDQNTGANGAYRDSCSGNISMGPAPAPATPSTPSMYSPSQSGASAVFSWTNVGASGYSYSGSASGSTGSTSVQVFGSYGQTLSLSVQAYNSGDGVNTAGTSYSGTSSASLYLAYPAPSAPSTPSVSGSASGNSAVFSWNNVGASYYNVYINGSFYTSTTSTGVTIGSSPGGNTSCYVQAVNSNPDGATAASGVSNTASVHIPNPPAAPGTPTLSGSVSGTTASLSWTDVSATGYNVYRNGSFLKGVTGATSTTDAGLTRGSTYSYTVVPYNQNSDGTTNGGTSNAVSLYVLNPPAAPAGTTLSGSAHANGDGGVDLSWSAVTCTGYRVTRDGVQILDRAIAGGTTFTDTGRTQGSTYSYVVTTYNTNADGTTLGAASNALSITIPTPPAAPSAPTLSGSADANTGIVSLSWTNVSATAYDLYKDTALFVSAITGLSYSDSTNAANTTHSYYVKPYNTNAVGRTNGTNSNTVSVTVPLPPPPAAPATPTLSATATNSQQGPSYNGSIDLSWTNVSVSGGYRLYRDGSLYQTLGTSVTSYADANMPYSTSHTYKVVAFNQNAGGTTVAPDSNTVSATVPLPNPPPAPAAPSSVTLTASRNYQQITLTWTSVAASGYDVYRNGTLLTTLTTTTFSESRPAESTTTYYILPFNTATNPGGTTRTNGTQSNSVSVLSKAVPPHSVGMLIG